METCTLCNKTNIDPSDMDPSGCCENCFEKNMETEEKHFDIYYSQNQLCFLCKQKLYSWNVKNIDGIERAVCWKQCDLSENRYTPIILKKEDLNL